EHDDRLDLLCRHRIDLAVDRGRTERGREEAGLDRGVLREPRGEVFDLAGLDVALEPAAAPAPDDRRTLPGADRRLDLRLVRVVLELGERDLRVGVGLVEALDRVLADALLRLAGQEPVRRRTGTGAAASAARAGGAAGGQGRPRGGTHGQVEEVPPGYRSAFHADLRTVVAGQPQVPRNSASSGSEMTRKVSSGFRSKVWSCG